MNKLFSVCFFSLLFALAGCSSTPSKQGLSSENKELGHDISTMPGHDMSKMPGHDMSKMPGHQHQPQHQHLHQHETADGDYLKAEPMYSNFGGPYQRMNAIGSGTSLIPADSPAYMWHFNLFEDKANCMAHAELKASFNSQGGPRGVSALQSQNWLMASCEVPVWGQLSFPVSRHAYR
jgi:hypothetical protein